VAERSFGFHRSLRSATVSRQQIRDRKYTTLISYVKQ
jgi:hypothetical protein